MQPTEHRRAVKALIVATCAYYGHKLEDHVVEMYADDLEGLSLEELQGALGKIRRDPKISRFPLPAVILDRIHPADTDDSDAREAAALIIHAVSRCGWPNPEGARNMIGELGWYVVQRQGGWLTVCQELNYENVGQLQAQWRDLALSAIKRARAGTLHVPPALPSVPHPLDSPNLKIIPKPPEMLRLEKLQIQAEQLQRLDTKREKDQPCQPSPFETKI